MLVYKTGFKKVLTLKLWASSPQAEPGGPQAPPEALRLQDGVMTLLHDLKL